MSDESVFKKEEKEEKEEKKRDNRKLIETVNLASRFMMFSLNVILFIANAIMAVGMVFSSNIIAIVFVFNCYLVYEKIRNIIKELY